DNIQKEFEIQRATVTRADHSANASRERAQFAFRSEDELTKLIEEYVKSAFRPLRKLSLAMLFDAANWVKGIKAIVKSPVLLSLFVRAALSFGGASETLPRLSVPRELGLSIATLLTVAPLLILAATLYVRLTRARMSTQLDRVRQLVLQAVI